MSGARQRITPAALAPGHLPDARPTPGRPLHALLDLVDGEASASWTALADAEARLPAAFAAFGDAYREPAAAAQAVLTFKLQATGPEQAPVPAGARVAAQIPPEVGPGGQTLPAREVIFATQQPFTALRGGLTTLHCVDPQNDAVVDLTGQIGKPLRLFDDWQPAPHRIYLGSDALFALKGFVEIGVSLDFRTADERASAARPILTDWEYASDAGWLPLELVRDATGRFSVDGEMTLRLTCGPDASAATVAGRTSHWIRGAVSTRPVAVMILEADVSPDGLPTLRPAGPHDFQVGDVVSLDGENRATIVGQDGNALVLDRSAGEVTPGVVLRLADPLAPLRPSGSDVAGLLAELDTIRARVAMGETDLVPSIVLANGADVDPSAAFFPFGQTPVSEPALHIASDEVFGRKGAIVRINGPLNVAGRVGGSLAIVAEYYDGRRWAPLPGDAGLAGEATFFTADNPAERPPISFRAPEDWAKAEVGGQSALWLRLRVISGVFAANRFKVVEGGAAGAKTYSVEADPDAPRPPLLGGLTLSWLYAGARAPLDLVLTENDFAYLDRTQDALWPQTPFAPFTPMSDTEAAVHLGFADLSPGALASLHVATEAGETRTATPLVWEYRDRDTWRELSVDDGGAGFTRSGLIRFVAPGDAARIEGLGGDLFRVRARLRSGAAPNSLPLVGLFPNATLAEHMPMERALGLGLASGLPGELMSLDPDLAPLQASPQIELCEWRGDRAAGEAALADLPASDVTIEPDGGSLSQVRIWVRWRALRTLALAGPDERVFTADWVAGVIKFGDGINGRMSIAGAPVRLVSRTGGGVVGNLAPGRVSQLQSPLPNVEAVTNPLPAAGGAEAEPLSRAVTRAAARFRHRGRAVSARDFEALARDASPEVAHAVCLPATSVDGRPIAGAVTLVVVPGLSDAEPLCSAVLLDRVRDYVAARAPWPAAQSVRIIQPKYRPVTVVARIVVSRDQAAGLEPVLRDRINRFLHPLTGGAAGAGWPFGATVSAAHVAAWVLGGPGVRRLAELRLMTGTVLADPCLMLGPHELPTYAAHRLTLELEA